MTLKLQLLSIFASGVLLAIVFELLRRRRLMERYALIWLGSSLVLLGLAIWKGLLDKLADVMGIAYPPNALFMIAFGFVLLLLLHFSLAISRLSNETKLLAQVVARLDAELREVRGRRGGVTKQDPLQGESSPEPAEPLPAVLAPDTER